jgi:hypothetical protein
MSIPLFYPTPTYVASLPLTKPMSLAELCARAGVPCRGSGAWTARQVQVQADRGGLSLTSEPGYKGRVRVLVPEHLDAQQAARVALGAMAYALMDLVARESIRGAAWAKPDKPRGRPPSGRALSSAQRQRAYRAKRALDVQRVPQWE